MGEMWYLGLVIGAFLAFIVSLTWVERTWRPKATEAPPEQAAPAERRAA
jgi:hypothetical protein